MGRQKLAMELIEKAIPVMERAIEEFLLADAEAVSYLQILENRSGHSVRFTRPVESQQDGTVTLTMEGATFSAGHGVLAAAGIQHRAIVLDVVDMNHLIGPVVAIFGAAGIEAPIDFSIHIERPQPSSGCLGMLLMPALWLLRAT